MQEKFQNVNPNKRKRTEVSLHQEKAEQVLGDKIRKDFLLSPFDVTSKASFESNYRLCMVS